MILEVARIVLVGALLVALPGFLLVQATFPPPRSRLTWTERAYLALACGLLLLATVGVLLGLLPHPGGRGFFRPPLVAAGVALVSVTVFKVGLDRGAYPRLAARLRGSRAPQPRAG